MRVPTHDQGGLRANAEVPDFGDIIRVPGDEVGEWRVTSLVHYSGAASGATNASTRCTGHFRAWRWNGREYICVDDLQDASRCQLTGDTSDVPPISDGAFGVRLIILSRL